MKYVLAPLAEYTDAAFRRMCVRRGADLTYSEMVSAAGLTHGSIPTRYLLETFADEGPVVCQLFGSKPDELAAAVREVSRLNRFAGIDFNAGCPMPRIVREGSGAALARNPQLTYDCLRAMAAETALPLSLKTRPGPSPDRVLALELLHAAEEAGCVGFTLHARFTSQMHGGTPHLDVLAEVVREAKIPVAGNGGVRTRADAAAMAQTGVAAIMVGRAAMSHPDIFAYLKADDGPDDPPPPGGPAMLDEHVAGEVELCEQIARHFPDATHAPTCDMRVADLSRRQFFRYFAGMPGAAEFRRRASKVRSLADLRALVDAAAALW